MADDALELSFHAAVEELVAGSVARHQITAMGHRREHFPREHVGLGLARCVVDLAGVVARHAPARVDGDRLHGHVPPHAHPAVAPRGAVAHRKLRLQPLASGRHFDRVGEARIAHVVDLGRLDEIDLRPRVGRLDVLHAGRVERHRLRVIGHRHRGVDHVGEVVGGRVDQLVGLVHRHPRQLHPAARLVVEVEGLDVVLGVPRRNQRLVVGHGKRHVLQELRPVRQVAITAPRPLGDVGHAHIERRHVLLG